MPSPMVPLDEDAVRQVLARALELESQRGNALTELQVREIARELSIPDDAIEQALSEYRNGAANHISQPTPKRWLRSRVIAAVLVGIALLAIALWVTTVRIPVSVPPS